MKHLLGALLVGSVLAVAPAWAQDGGAGLDENSPPATRPKPPRPHPERHRAKTLPAYDCPKAGASCNVSCSNGNGGITCRVGEVCSCSCSGNYPRCSCD